MPSRISTNTLADLAKDSPITTCSFEYLVKTELYDDKKPYYSSGLLNPEQEAKRSNLKYTTQENIQVQDLRGNEQNFRLDEHGFELVAHIPKTNLIDPGDEQLERYLEEMSSFIKDKFKAELVLAYNYRVSIQNSIIVGILTSLRVLLFTLN